MYRSNWIVEDCTMMDRSTLCWNKGKRWFFLGDRKHLITYFIYVYMYVFEASVQSGYRGAAAPKKQKMVQ